MVALSPEPRRGRVAARWRVPGGALLLAMLSGLLYALCFPPFEARALAWFALAPLFAALARSGALLAFVLGFAWCLVAGTGVAGFLPGMLSDFLGWPRAAGVAVFAATLSALASLYGAWTAWLAWLARRGRATPLAAAAGFAVCEFARFSLPPPAGWAPLATSQALGTRVIQTADLAGVLLPGMLLVAASFAVACLFKPALRPRRNAARMVGVAVAVACALLYGEWRLSQPFRTGDALRVALVQNGVERRFRFDPRLRIPNLESHLALSREALDAEPGLILWPEHAVDFYLREPSPLRDRILAITEVPGPDLLLGGPHYHGARDEIRFTNSIFLIRNGRFAGRSDKLELLPLAETRHFNPAEELRLLKTSQLRLGAFVCSEAIGSDVPRRLVKAGAEILVNPSNDSWFSDPAAARLHLLSAAVRSVENRRSVLRPTPTGYSAVIDPHGRLLAVGPIGRPAVVLGTAHPASVVTLFQHVGDLLGWISLAIVAGASYCCVGVENGEQA
jgi:apolipoprotein N-acyltransferase